MITQRAGIPGIGGTGHIESVKLRWAQDVQYANVGPMTGVMPAPQTAVISCNNWAGFTTSRSVPIVHDENCRHLVTGREL